MKRPFRTFGWIFGIVLLLSIIGSFANGSGSSDHHNNSSSTSRVESQSDSKSESKPAQESSKTKPQSKPAANQSQSTSELAALDYHSGDAAYIDVNGGQSTLKASDWKTNHIDYANLDSLNRTSSPNTADLEQRNVANDSLRTTQTVYPTGWHQKFVNRTAIINRGHMIAYSLSKGISADGLYSPSDQSGDQNNPKNLFTQTAFSNQRIQTIYETKVRNALRDGKRVIYQVQPIFRGDELMARGVHLQALSTDGTLNFNVYLFNVQPGIKFDYATGRSTIDNSMSVPTPAGAPTFHDGYGSSGTTRHHSYVGSALGAYGAYRVYKHYQRKHTNRAYISYRNHYSHRTYYRHLF